MVAVDEPIAQPELHSGHQLSLPVDAEHSGIRLAGCGTLIAAFVGLFAFASYFTALSGVLVLLISLIAASGIAYSMESILKKRWPSGRILQANQNGVALHKNEQVEREIDPQQQVNVLAWHFKVERTSRVKKGWFVVCLALEQEGEYVTVYTFSSPEIFETIPLSRYFQKLEKTKKNKRDNAKSIANMRHAGEQRRLHEAEADRGYFGAEVTLPQFISYLEFLQKNYPKWMLS